MDKAMQLKMAITYGKSSQSQLAKILNMTSQNFSQKMNKGTFKDEEMEKICAALNARYIPAAIEFSDGTKF